MAKLHKVEFFIVDWDNGFTDDYIEEDPERLFEDDAGIMLSKIQTTDIGEWDDNHKFNLLTTPLEEYEKEFE